MYLKNLKLLRSSSFLLTLYNQFSILQTLNSLKWHLRKISYPQISSLIAKTKFSRIITQRKIVMLSSYQVLKDLSPKKKNQ